MSVYIITVMAVVAVLTLVVRLLSKDYAIKCKATMITLPSLAVIAGVQAIVAKVPRISIAWWLVIAIFVVLFINTCISYCKWKKYYKKCEDYEDYTEEKNSDKDDWFTNYFNDSENNAP